ncbi:unnamed protein product [Brachionus calyciflorus]|uniref:Uncharacterized protein n=1 Tax=Brachionus calyciflorus TaxID=104777 RepID=A0A814DKS2_9BILA|nr:unnamed protein product [Brachionus calyciflorus]
MSKFVILVQREPASGQNGAVPLRVLFGGPLSNDAFKNHKNLADHRISRKNDYPCSELTHGRLRSRSVTERAVK